VLSVNVIPYVFKVQSALYSTALQFYKPVPPVIRVWFPAYSRQLNDNNDGALATRHLRPIVSHQLLLSFAPVMPFGNIHCNHVVCLINNNHRSLITSSRLPCQIAPTQQGPVPSHFSRRCVTNCIHVLCVSLSVCLLVNESKG
jgi:hypothetical protein